MEQELAERLARLHDGRTLFVFSSDFTHYGPSYGYTPFGPSATAARARILGLQQRAIGLLGKQDATGFRRLLDSTGATICGRRGLSVMLELLARIAPRAHALLLAHYASSDLPDSQGDDGVWYVALAYVARPAAGTEPARPMSRPPQPVVCTSSSPPLGRAVGQELVRIARATLNTEFKGTDDLRRELGSLPNDRALDRWQAVFVTLLKNGRLRGCIGQLEPEYPLPQAVVHLTLRAAREDPRFRPVGRDELDGLSVEVTALMPSRRVSSWREIELGKHGIVLEQGRRRAVFLPQVPQEQGWTLEQTLQALSRKAGLPTDAWQMRLTELSVFTGQVFREQEQPAGATRSR
jgi:AmmeMemoRadiSam system protein A